MRDVRTLPKAHLHFHLEASARPETITEFAARDGINYHPRNSFQSFADFNDCYAELVSHIRSPADLTQIINEIVEDNAADGVRYIEPQVLPAAYCERFGMSEHEVYMLMRDTFWSAGERHGIDVGMLLAGIWTFDLSITVAAAQFAAEHAGEGVVAFGLCGPEPQTSYAGWSRPCDIARDAGLGIIPHAGEFGGAENVRGAIEILQGDRIAHGVRAVEDDETVRFLADSGVVCDVAPSSNVVLGVFPEMRDVPIDRFLEAGVRFTLNDDDALFFGSRVGNEYALVRETFGLSDHELAGIARTSVDCSFASPATKERLLGEIDAWLDPA